jgi:hypothetical protein
VQVKCNRAGQGCGRCARLGLRCVDQSRGRGRPPGRADAPCPVRASQAAHAASAGQPDADEAAPSTPPAAAPEEPLTGGVQTWPHAASPTAAAASSEAAASASAAAAAGGLSAEASQQFSALRFDDAPPGPEASASPEPRAPAACSGSLFGLAGAAGASASSGGRSGAGRSGAGRSGGLRPSSDPPPQASEQRLRPAGNAHGGDAVDLAGLGLAQPFDVDSLVDDGSSSSTSNAGAVARPNKRPYFP